MESQAKIDPLRRGVGHSIGARNPGIPPQCLEPKIRTPAKVTGLPGSAAIVHKIPALEPPKDGIQRKVLKIRHVCFFHPREKNAKA
jgi:hypothetical protein